MFFNSIKLQRFCAFFQYINFELGQIAFSLKMLQYYFLFIWSLNWKNATVLVHKKKLCLKRYAKHQNNIIFDTLNTKRTFFLVWLSFNDKDHFYCI